MNRPKHTQPRRIQPKRTEGGAKAAYARAGYTMVEVMMGLALLAIGATGIMSLQRMSVLGALTGRHLTNATTVAQNVIEQINGETHEFVRNTPPFAAGWLGAGLDQAGATPVASAWTTIANRAFLVDGTQVDATLVPLDPAVGTDPVVAYCTHVQVSWVGDPAALVRPASTVRVEVRTFFARSGRPINRECQTWSPLQTTNLFNGTLAGGLTDGQQLRTQEEYGVVYLATFVRRR